VPTLTLAQARRIAVAAQGFTDRRPAPGAATMRHIDRVVRRVGVVQIDSVNVLVRSQYLPFYSRLGPYDVTLLDRARDVTPHRLVEYWAHEASLIPPTTWPLLNARMRRAHDESWGGMARTARDHPETVDAVRHLIGVKGPMTAREIEVALAHDVARDRTEWGWNWSIAKRAVEFLFWSGEITSAGRTSAFERRYAALTAVAPHAEPHRTQWLDPASRPPDDEALTELVRIAARAHGVGTMRCLRDYFRLRPEQAAPAVERLVRTGELVPVDVAGWRAPAYLWAEAARPRRVRVSALLSPFDSLVWQRDRLRALFGFDYRLEIYVPAHRRVHGYYVLPFLLDDQIVARVDLKADRAASALLVHGVHVEAGAPQHTPAALAAELRQLADWLQLGDVTGPAAFPLRA
jgi:uncharacterized protein YcaQ